MFITIQNFLFLFDKLLYLYPIHKNPQPVKVVTVKCKPYVKRYLEMEYGVKQPPPNSKNIPVKLTDKSALGRLFLNMLSKPRYRHDKYYSKLALDNLSQQVEIIISDANFYRYGWNISKTNTIELNRFAEELAKNFLHREIRKNITCFNLKDAILIFQKEHGFCEDTWPYASIRKHIDRTREFRAPHEIIKKTCQTLYNNLLKIETQ